jgi:uncharacterized protein DUF748
MDIRATIGRFRRVPYPRTLATAAVLWLVYLVVGYFLVPRWIAQAIPDIVSEQLQRKATVGSVRVNPLLFRVLVRDFALKEKDGSPIVAFRRLLVDFELSSIVRWAWTFSSIRLDGLDLRVEIRPDGTLNLAALKGDPGPAEGEAKGNGGLPRLLLQHASLRGGTVTFTDRTASTPTSATLQPIDLELRDISTLPDPRGPYTVSAILRDGGVLFWRGGVALNPIHSQGEIAARRIRLATPWRFLRDRLNLAEPGGAIEFSARYRFAYADERPQFALEDVRLAVTGIRLAAADAREPTIELKKVEATGGRFDLEQRRVTVPRVAISGGFVHIVRDSAGKLRIAEMLGAAGGGAERVGAARGARKAPAGGAAWRATLDAFELDGVRVSLADEGYRPAVRYDFDVVRALVSDISTDGRTPLKFEATLRVAQGGAISAAGSVTDEYSRVTATVKAERIALKPLQPLISRDGALRLESGELSADVKAEYRAGGGRSELRASGRAGIGNLLLNESSGGDRLIAWKELAASGVAFTLNPARLAVREVRLVRPGAKIVIFKDRSLNLVKAFQPQPAQGAAAAAPESATPRPAAAGDGSGAATPIEIAVERIRVDDGTVDFSDLSLVLPFAAKVEEFGGTITGISTDPAGAAALKLEGKVGDYGLANVDGTLKPFRPKVHTDIGVVFRNVEMVPLSPYSATFAGRRIATGKVSLDLRYKIENSQLAGENSVVLERFTLGERVESPGALNLPFDLAIALLTDSDGKINVAVPVKGNVDDPQFSYGHLIWQAVATVITNIVTAPFRALAGLFGGGGEGLENIAFDAGRATLRPPEREKLKRVATGIAKRPQLVLVAEGQYGDADLAALRERDVALAIAGKLDHPPAPGAAPDPVNTLDGKTQRALEALFVERASEDALTRFVAEAEKARGKPVDRANPVLALAGRGSSDGAFYQALLRRLNETARVPADAPRQLADARARAVAGHMREALAVPESRLAARTAAEPGGALVKLTFDAVRQESAKRN